MIYHPKRNFYVKVSLSVVVHYMAYGRKLLPSRDIQVRVLQISLFVLFVAWLEYLARTGQVGAITLVPPTEMGATLIDLFQGGELLENIWVTFSSIFAAFFLAVATGLPFGWLLWRRPTLHKILDPYLIAYYAMPVFVFYPLFIAIFGLGSMPIILIGYLLGVIAVTVNTANGFRKVPEVYRNVGRSLKLSSRQSAIHIYLPAAGPYIFTGLKLGFIYSFIGVIASEFILSNSGLGYLIQYNYQNFVTDEMYAVMLLLVTIAVVTNLLLIRIENRMYRRSTMN